MQAATDNSHTEVDPVLQPISFAPAVYIGHHVMSDGAPATTVEGKAVAYASGTIHIDETAIKIPRVNDPIVPTTMVAAGLTFSVGPFSGQSNDLPVLTIGDTLITANKASEFVYEGQTLTDNNAGFTISGTRIPLDGSRTKAATGTSTESWSLGSIIMNGFGNPSLTTLVTINGITFSMDESQAMVSGTTYSLGQTQFSSTLFIGSQTFILGPSDIIAKATFSPYTAKGFTFSMDGSHAIVSDTMYSLGQTQPSSTLVLGSQTIIPGPIDISAEATLSAFTADGLTFSMGKSQAIVSGTTYTLGATQPSSTLVIDGQTFILGPNGISAKATLSPYTANGLTFSMDATKAIISGTTFSIGPGANPFTVVLGNETVSIGPSGVGLASTTIALPNATGTGFEYFTGHASPSIVASNSILGVSLICVLITIAIL